LLETKKEIEELRGMTLKISTVQNTGGGEAVEVIGTPKDESLSEAVEVIGTPKDELLEKIQREGKLASEKKAEKAPEQSKVSEDTIVTNASGTVPHETLTSLEMAITQLVDRLGGEAKKQDGLRDPPKSVISDTPESVVQDAPRSVQDTPESVVLETPKSVVPDALESIAPEVPLTPLAEKVEGTDAANEKESNCVPKSERAFFGVFGKKKRSKHGKKKRIFGVLGRLKKKNKADSSQEIDNIKVTTPSPVLEAVEGAPAAVPATPTLVAISAAPIQSKSAGNSTKTAMPPVAKLTEKEEAVLVTKGTYDDAIEINPPPLATTS